SPITSSGWRTLTRTICMSTRLASPRSNNFMIGMRSPSSNTSRASAERIRPPISALWQVLANNATSLPLRKIGVVMVMSFIWPAVCQGSLVISTSPGARCSRGNAARKCLIDVAMALMWPGVPLIDCAIIRPLVSNMPQARSWLSRTMVLKAVRMSASCCSLAAARSRFQITSSVMGSIGLRATLQFHHDIQLLVDLRSGTDADDQGRLALLHDRRAGKVHSRLQRVAIIDRRFDVAAALREKGLARSLARVFRRPAVTREIQIHFRLRSARRHPPVDHFQRDIGPLATVQGCIGLFKSGANARQIGGDENAVGQLHRHFMPLADVAHIGRSGKKDFVRAQAG